MDALSATKKVYSRLTGDLEADRTSRPPAATAQARECQRASGEPYRCEDVVVEARA